MPFGFEKEPFLCAHLDSTQPTVCRANGTDGAAQIRATKAMVNDTELVLYFFRKALVGCKNNQTNSQKDESKAKMVYVVLFGCLSQGEFLVIRGLVVENSLLGCMGRDRL